MRNQIYFWAAIAWTGLILFLCLDSADNLPKIKVQNFDKIAHAGIHFVFTVLWFLVFYKKKTKAKRVVNIAFLLSVFYGVFLEFLQNTLTTSRSADVFDVFANVLGAFIAVLLVYYFKKLNIKANLSNLQ